jgi:glucuronate isomerase
MNRFMNEDFMLQTETAIELFHRYAENQPIIDYHCHLSPKDIAEDRCYENISRLWLEGDHYKWRAMRNCGVDERFITGNGSDYEKFLAFAQIMPTLIGNPLYHWCHLELKRYFDVDLVINGKNALSIWEACSKKCKGLSVKKLIGMSQVTHICTTDDPVDSLEYHRAILLDTAFKTKVLPAFRPDRAVNIEKDGFASYIEQLGMVCGISISNVTSLKKALLSRITHFASNGCRASDHGLTAFPFREADEVAIERIFAKALNKESLTLEEEEQYKTNILLFLGKEYHRLDWVMEIHFGVVRNASYKHSMSLGADTGYDAIGEYPMSGASFFLSALEKEDSLPRTILYSINPVLNAEINSICACFQEAGTQGKVQQGSAWWFNDSKVGMEEQLKSYAGMASLGTFVGMLTDSRSILSYTRHEYFRRILCNYIGTLIEDGEYPSGEEIGPIIENICYNNAKKFFGLQ